jgi:hypothetical protein
MVIHTKGPKAERDRIILLRAYRSICRELWLRPIAESKLVKMSNYDLDRLARDLYANLTDKQTRWMSEVRGTSPRSREFRARWFWHDLLNPRPKRKHNPVKPFVPLVMAKAANEGA